MNYSREELEALGLRAGEECRVHRSVEFFRPEGICLGAHVRVDAFALLSAGEEGIAIGDYTHVGAGVMLFGAAARVALGRFCSLSPRVTVFTATDRFRSDRLIGACLPERFRSLRKGPIVLEDHCAVGSGATLWPGVVMGYGAALGAGGQLRRALPAGLVSDGVQAVGRRDLAALRDLEEAFRREYP